MSLEAIQTITGAEQAVREQKARAADEAKRIGGVAVRAARLVGADARAPAEEPVMPMRAAAAPRAGEHSAQTLGDSAAQCESLKQAARGRLEQAAGLIVGRVGNS